MSNSPSKKINVDTLVEMKVQDAKVGQTIGKLTLVDKLAGNLDKR